MLIIISYYSIISFNLTSIKISVIEKSNIISRRYKYPNIIENYFLVSNKIKSYYTNLSNEYLLIEHNLEYDDILFLIPLYTIIIKSDVAVICDGKYDIKKYVYHYYQTKKYNYSVNNYCIYIKIYYLRLLQIHSNLLRKCHFHTIHSMMKNTFSINMEDMNNFCIIKNYTLNYTIVTTVYKRNYIKKQIKYFNYQSIKPNSIIVVHDRNYVNVNLDYNDIMYIHVVNFKAGFYFRYLLALLSLDDDVLIYDDDFIPTNSNSYLKWINTINNRNIGIYCHRLGKIKGISWCATPLIIKRKFLFLQWINRIYETTQAEDCHLSFSVLLLCNIVSYLHNINGIVNINDNFSSSREKLKPHFWDKYINYIINNINSTYINDIKRNYFIT